MHLEWSTNVGLDLAAVYDQSDSFGALIDAFFDLLEVNAEIRRALCENGFRHLPNPRFDSAPVVEAVRSNRNINYVKLWLSSGQLVPWRVLYAVDYRSRPQRICILGLMPRDDDYDLASDFWRRIFADYDLHNVPRIMGA